MNYELLYHKYCGKFSYSKSFEDYGRNLSVNPIIWKPSEERVKKTAMYRFMHEQGCENYFQLHDWSINSRTEFWKSIVDFCDIKFHENASILACLPAFR